MTFFVRTSDSPDIVEKIENVVSFDKWRYENDTWFITSVAIPEFPSFISRQIVIRENVISIEVN